ncbi:MAG: PhoH family protein [Erysipelotrichaceae bacterium]|nr:MAG: PhoH family [Erysipelotrichaceae bacterium]TXT17352.1 MAG: PhoH family protein [Erysipelotrichaceae bacterium]
MIHKNSLALDECTFEEFQTLCGHQDENLRLLKQVFNVDFVIRDNALILDSLDENTTDHLKRTLNGLIRWIKMGKTPDERDIIYLSHCVINNTEESFFKLNSKIIGRTALNKPISIKTLGQQKMMEAMAHYDMVFVSGPAGTGKTYLSVVYAVDLLKKGDIKRIVLTRPIVEAGESLGFLPGEIKEKVDPYLRPLYDGLNDLLGNEQVQKYIEKGTIEIAPMAYMRGRTLEDAFVILDEAQNTTKSQMLMVLTRMGFRTKIIINGDTTQIDLKQDSGFIQALRLLKGKKDIGFVELTPIDIVRNPLVQIVIEAYTKK